MEGRASRIPNFVRAGSPIGLRRAMLQVNARLGAEVRYFDIGLIQSSPRPYWIAWYYADPEGDDPLWTPSPKETTNEE